MKYIELMDPFPYILAAELRRYEGLKSVLDYSTNRRAKHILMLPETVTGQ